MRRLSKSGGALAKNQYDGVVVVPAFDEGYILRTMFGIASQQEITEARIAVVIAVNNGPDASTAIRENNLKTMKLVQAVWDGSPPDDLLQNDVPFLPRGKIAEAFDACAASQHQFIIADASTPGHEIPECNVGRARNAGGDVALDIVKPGGMLAFTDADSKFAEKYMQTLLELRAKGCEAATGPISYEPDKTPESLAAFRLMQLRDDMRDCYRKIAGHLVQFRRPLPPARHRDNTMPGANLTVSPDRFAEVRFPPVGGGEDIAFSLELLRRGVNIQWHRNLRVHTPLRVSLRTEAGHGLGQRVAQEALYGDRYAEYPVETLRQYLYLNALMKHLEWVRAQRGSRRNWKKHAAAFRFCDAQDAHVTDDVAPLTGEEINELWRELRRAPRISHLEVNDFLRNVAARMAEERFPDVAIRSTIDDTRAFVLGRETTSPPERRHATVVLRYEEQDWGPNAPLPRCFARLTEAMSELAKTSGINLEPMLAAIRLPWSESEAERQQLHREISAVSRGLNLRRLIGVIESWSDDIAAFELRLHENGCKTPEGERTMRGIAQEISKLYAEAFLMEMRAAVSFARIKSAREMLAGDPSGYLMEVHVFIGVIRERIRQKKEELFALYLRLEALMQSCTERLGFPECSRATLQDMTLMGLQIQLNIAALGGTIEKAVAESDNAIQSGHPSAGK